MLCRYIFSVDVHTDFSPSSLHRHGIDISIAVGVMVGGWREIVCLEGELKRKKKCAALHLILYPHAGSV